MSSHRYPLTSLLLLTIIRVEYFIRASNALVQSYPNRTQICSLGYAKPSNQSYPSPEVSDLYWPPLCAFSTGMADVTCEEGVEGKRIGESSDRLPTPCLSDVESQSQRTSGRAGTSVPTSPALSALTESAGSLRLTSSPSLSESSVDDFEMPPTPRVSSKTLLSQSLCSLLIGRYLFSSYVRASCLCPRA